MPEQNRPLIVRLRNWVGDVTLSVPLLQRLEAAGHGLQLVGKGWARDLLAGHGWPVHVLPTTWRDRVALLKRLKHDALRADPGFAAGNAQGLNALCLPYSFSSALEFRLAGLHALGYGYEGRSPLLRRALRKPAGVHELRVYWALGDALLGRAAEPPQHIGLRPSAAHVAAAQALLRRHAVAPGVIMICPFAGGTWIKQDKTWPGFADFAARVLPGFGRDVIVCPSPGEEQIARTQFPGATLLPGIDLGTYAALMQQASMMIANDTGPGHMAAAVGLPLISVLGPSDPALWGAWGSSARILGGGGRWPAPEQVRDAVARCLQQDRLAAPLSAVG